MNIALLCVVIIITGETDGFHVGNIRAPSKEMGERISLRKLLSFERDDPKETKTATWNQILADALVNRIKVFSFHPVTENEQADTGTSNDFLTNCISQMMHLYKTLVYDQIHRRPDNARSYDTELNKVNIKEHINVVKDVDEIGKDTDPKEEVEIIEAKYHGKMCDNCGENKQSEPKNGTSEIVETTEKVLTSVSGCSPGLVASERGCTDPKSKFILSIPYQCPIGYRRDWLGYCRPRL